MGTLSSLRSTLLDARAYARMAPEVHKILPVGIWGPARLLAENVRVRPDAPALLFGDERYTWGQVDDWATRYARVFREKGIRKGDAVAILMDNRPDYLFAQLGLAKLGALSALINTSLRGKPLIHAVSVTSAPLLLAGAEHAAVVQEARGELGATRVLFVGDGPQEAPVPTIDAYLRAQSVDPIDVPLTWATSPVGYIFTSGTTGLPKAAVISNQRYVGAAMMYARVIHQCGPGDVIYVTLPLYHSNAQWMGWGAAMASGATVALRRKFSASAFWPDVIKHRATHFLYIGEICRYLLRTSLPEGARHTLRVGVGNGLRADVWTEFQKRFRVPTIREFYGATEGNILLLNLEGRPGMVGRLKIGQHVVACDLSTGEPLRGPDGLCREVGPGEVGLLVARINPLLRFEGYVDKGATQKKILDNVLSQGDQYFNSGDLLQRHDDDWVSFADRVGDTFRWKGENVSTREVSQVLDAATGVVESNVYGVEVKGAEGKAGMASLRVGPGFSIDAFAAHVVERLPGFQRPYFVRLQEEMELTGTFKQRKVDYQKQGYDPSRCTDPLYFLDGDRYRPIDTALFAQLAAGEIGPRG